MKYLVTGGAGFIGSNLVDKLISQDHQVEVWDSLITGDKNNVNPKAFFKKVSVESIKHEYYSDRSFDAIFHLAALSRIQPSFAEPLKTHEANVTGTINMLELAIVTGSRFVFAGSSSVYHDMFANPYSFSKQIGEYYCKLYAEVYNVPVAIARFFNVYGPRQLEEGAYSTVIGIFENQFRKKMPLTITGDGNQRRDFTHVNDIVDGLIAMSKKNYKAEVFDLGTGTNFSINEVAQMFNHEFIYISKRPGEAQTTLADISYAQKELVYSPKIDLKNYITKVVKQEIK